MIKYKIVSAYNVRDMNIEVNKAIEDGWKLQGGVSAVDRQMIQAMVKEELSRHRHTSPALGDWQRVQ